MSLTKEIVIDKYEIIGEYKQIQLREAIVIKEDGSEISRTFHRRLIQPNMDISSESSEIQAITSAIWTQDIKDAWGVAMQGTMVRILHTWKSKY